MVTKSKAAKHCDPKPLEAEEEPSHGWELDRLSEYARRQHAEIIGREGTLAPYYWRLGNALCIARKDFHHGQWESYLGELMIDKTRSSKACAIFRAFSTAAEVETLTVEEAYAARHKPSDRNAEVDRQAELPVKLSGALARMEKTAERTLAVAGELSRAEKRELLTRLQHAVRLLEEHVRLLQSELDGDAEAAP